jgi:cytochrome c-type biogenesis protein CcmH
MKGVIAKSLSALLLALACCLPLQAKEAMPLSDEPQVEARLVAIADELRCLVCQNESLASSHAELAEALRNEVRKLIREGKSDAEIKQFLVARYGDFVLYQPPLKASTMLLWFGPALLFVLGLGALLFALRRRNALLADDALSSADNARADALLQSALPPSASAKDPQ